MSTKFVLNVGPNRLAIGNAVQGGFAMCRFERGELSSLGLECFD